MNSLDKCYPINLSPSHPLPNQEKNLRDQRKPKSHVRMLPYRLQTQAAIIAITDLGRVEERVITTAQGAKIRRPRRDPNRLRTP